jgi:hypothetical protein
VREIAHGDCGSDDPVAVPFALHATVVPVSVPLAVPVNATPLQFALNDPAALVAVWLDATHLKSVHVFGFGMIVPLASCTDCHVPASALVVEAVVGVVTDVL